MKYTSHQLIKDDVSEKHDFRLSETSIEEANLLRVTMIADVPCLAIDEVKILVNSTPFPPEMIAERIYNLHLKNDPELTEDAMYTLEKKCPDNKEKIEILSQDLPGISDFVIPNVLILPLETKQTVKIKYSIGKGTHREHARWSTISACGYKHIENKKEELMKKTIDFHMETTNILGYKKIILTAINVILDRLEHVKLDEETSNSNNIKERVVEVTDTSIRVELPTENMIFGYIISVMLLSMTDVVDKAAHIQPTHLEPKSFIYLKVLENMEGSQEMTPIEVFNNAIDNLTERYNDLKKQVKYGSKKE